MGYNVLMHTQYACASKGQVYLKMAPQTETIGIINQVRRFQKNNNLMAVIIFIMCFVSGCTNQSDYHKNENCSKVIEGSRIIYIDVNKMPVFRNGTRDLLTFFAKNVSNATDSIQSVVYLEFIVSPEGKIFEERIYKKRKEDYSLIDKEYLKALSTMPNWHPGECNGKKVAVRMRFPIKLEFSM